MTAPSSPPVAKGRDGAAGPVASRGASKRGASRRRVLDAALEIFWEKGYEPTGIADIVARSGVSVGSVYHHFGSKDGIAEALYLDLLGAQFEDFAAAVGANTEEPEAFVRAAVSWYLGWVRENPKKAAFIYNQNRPEWILSRAGPVKDLNTGFFHWLEDRMRPHREAGRLKPLRADIASAVLFGPAIVAGNAWLQGRAPALDDAVEEALAAAAWAALKAD